MYTYYMIICVYDIIMETTKIKYFYRIATEMECFRVMTMFGYIISEKPAVKDQYHHFHIIEYLEIVLHLNT